MTPARTHWFDWQLDRDYQPPILPVHSTSYDDTSMVIDSHSSGPDDWDSNSLGSRSQAADQPPASHQIADADLACALDQLHPVQAAVIRYRHGLDGPALSASETAAKLGRTRRQVEYIERMALLRLRELLEQAA